MDLRFGDKGMNIFNRRQADHEIDPIFLKRWSPRAFDPEPIPEDALMSIFEAARWSMSCYNEQPWRFIYADTKEDLELFRSPLTESNQIWTASAPVVGYFLAAKKFARNNKPNRWAQFDTGAAWMAMSLQARMMGLYTHGMGGFDVEKAYEVLNVPKDEYYVIAAFALGQYGDREKLPDNMKKTEQPNDRKPLSELLFHGVMK